MAQIFTSVKRGDLITAQSFNEILDKMYEMESRIELLESGVDAGSVVKITQFSPLTEQNIGRTLEIIGANFESPPEKNSVTVDGVAVTMFGISTVQLLRIVIPNISGVPKNAQITITNANGSVSRLYSVLEEIPVAGDPPDITTIAHSDGNPVLKVGGQFVIKGTHFGAVPVLRLRSREAGHLSDVYNITNIETVTANQILATLPEDISLVGAPLFPGGPSRPDAMEIELTIGAFNPVIAAVQVEV